MTTATDITKLASQVPAVLAEASSTLKKLAAANASLVSENEGLRTELRLTKIAQRMEDRGLEPSLGFAEKLSKLQEIPATKLDAFEMAIEMGPSTFKLGSLEDEDTRTTSMSGSVNLEAAAKNLEDFISSGAALSS